MHVVYGARRTEDPRQDLLVVRREGDGIRRYCHIGTGNYNPKTATIYEDLGHVHRRPRARRRHLRRCSTTSPATAGQLGYRDAAGRADASARRACVELIRAQAHADGRITIKMNSARRPRDDRRRCTTARRRVRGSSSSFAASAACAPGVPGLSENIPVRSLVGRYLEHSRILRFGHPGAPDAEYIIGSADLMPRNLDRRVEVLARYRPGAAGSTRRDSRPCSPTTTPLRGQLTGDGTWRPPPASGTINAQTRLEQAALSRARGVVAV